MHFEIPKRLSMLINRSKYLKNGSSPIDLMQSKNELLLSHSNSVDSFSRCSINILHSDQRLPTMDIMVRIYLNTWFEPILRNVPKTSSTSQIKYYSSKT